MPLVTNQLKERTPKWKLRKVVHNHPAKDRPIGLPARYASIRYSKQMLRPAPPAQALPSSLVLAPLWHTHPLGQTLIVTAGCGRVQREGGPIEEIRPGDVVWFPPGEKHWHGAAPATAMTHVAIQEQLNGKAVDWMEKVTDEE